MSRWYPALLPDLAGRRYLVTGANAGLGFFTVARLVGAGADVVLSGRDASRVETAAGVIRAQVERGRAAGEVGGSVSTLVMDVSSLESVRDGAAAIAADAAAGRPLDGLVLNAGMVHPPRRREVNADGNEVVLATNLLGHFTLVAELFGSAARPAAPSFAPDARIITLGSMATRLSTFRVDALQLERGYSVARVYAQSKIADQSFGFELDRRLRAAGSDVRSVVAHPGYSLSGRTPFVPGVNEPTRRTRFEDALQAFMAQGKHHGAEPILHALTAGGVEGGQYWGPRWVVKGAPTLQQPTRTSRAPGIATKVWAECERATGIDLPVDALARDGGEMGGGGGSRGAGESGAG